MTLTAFGQTEDGIAIEKITLKNGPLTASIITWGAVLQDLRHKAVSHPLVLGFQEFDFYPKYSPYFGAIAGRVCNRIANARFKLAGKTHNLDPNFAEKHTLHGGRAGIGKRVWSIVDQSECAVTLELEDMDGEMGFPGNATHRCIYSLTTDGALLVDLQSNVDRTTPINLTHHSYFNLDGLKDCRKHTLKINADRYLAVTDELIPDGPPRNVENTPFDFRKAKPIGQDLKHELIYDHNFCLSDAPCPLREVARLSSPDSILEMSVATTEPGLQFYAGHKINIPVEGLDGKNYGPYSGIALEAQGWPDAVNRDDFPSIIVSPDHPSRQVTEYRFSAR